MTDYKIYVSGNGSTDLILGLGAALEASGIHCKTPNSGRDAFSAEVVSLITIGASSLVALVSAILTYLGTKHYPSTVEIRTTNGATIKFPANASADELAKYLNLMESIEARHLLISTSSTRNEVNVLEDEKKPS
jgi:hypothetical protein